jgi:hypothetical protein
MRWQATYKEKGQEGLLLMAFMVLKVIVQYFLIHPSYDLHRDEYLHLDQAKHLAWGYFSVPPLTSWIAWVIKALGNDVFWVKFFPALFGSFTIYFAWKIVEELGGGLFAKVITATAIFLSVILRLNTLFQPNSFEVMSWTALYYFLVRYLKQEKPRDLYIMAVVLALSFLNKYNVIFPVAGLVVAWLLMPERKLLWGKHVAGAALLFIMLVLPNLVWQVQNNIPFIHHMKELSRTQLVNMGRPTFLKEQLLYFLNAFLLVLLSFIGALRFGPFKTYRMILLAAILTLLLYLWFRAKSYYAIGLYPALIAFGAVYFEVLTERSKRFLRWGGFAVTVLLSLPMLMLVFPDRSAEKIAANPEKYRPLGLLRWEDGKDHQLPQDFADMLGWRELAYKTDSAYNSLKDREAVIIIADNYGQAGAINYYSSNNLQAVAFNADYLNWFPYGKPIRHVIRVMEVDEDDDDPGRNQERSLCDTLILAGVVNNALARERGTRIYVMKQVNRDVWPLIMQEIEENKK